jgi:hypothetical protein
MKQIRAFAFVLSSILLVACSPESTAPSEPTTAEPPAPAAMTDPSLPATGGTIQGKAVIEMRNDTIQDLDGLELVLVPDAASREITKVREERWRLLASRFNFNDGYNNLDLQAIGATAVRLAVAQTKADASGVYAFRNVPPGSYRIYAQYRSMYAAGYWLIPVTVKEIGETITVDINNEKFAEVFNYQQK